MRSGAQFLIGRLNFGRHAQDGTKLLANLLPFVEPGALLADELEFPVFRAYWPLAQVGSFAPRAAAQPGVRRVRNRGVAALTT